MGMFDKLLKKEKKIVDDLESKMFLNHVNELIENNFNVMFIPLFDLFENQEKFKLKYRWCRDYEYICLNCHYNYESFNTKYYLECLKENKCIIIEIKNLGSLVFTNCHRDDLFLVLQRYYKDVTSYVFKGNDTGGYFKILRNGIIIRKTSSYLITEGIGNKPETRGKPCEYEIEKGKIRKVDMKAKFLKDMLTDFSMKDILDLFDYYIGLNNLKNDNVQRIIIYDLIED